MAGTPNVPHYKTDWFDKAPSEMTPEERNNAAIGLIVRYGMIDGDHHKQWLLDQTVRVLTGCPIVRSAQILDAHDNLYTCDMLGDSDAYQVFTREFEEFDEELGEVVDVWDEGIAP